MVSGADSMKRPNRAKFHFNAKMMTGESISNVSALTDSIHDNGEKALD